MTQKYKTKKVESALLNPAEKSRYDADLKNVLKPFNAALTYAQELEVIKLLAVTADIKYKSSKADIAAGSEDFNKTLIADDNAGKFDKLTQSAIKIWFYLNDEIPSKQVKMMKDKAKILEESKPNNPLRR